MSGTNPFRRKNIGEQSFGPDPAVNIAFPERSETRITPIDTDVPRTIKTKTGKTVRIISPHSATSEDDDVKPAHISPSSRPSFSPPPPGNIALGDTEDESPADPFSAESDEGTSTEDESTRQNTLSNSASPTSTAQGSKMISGNPFPKTLANLDTDIQLRSASSSSAQRPPEADNKNYRAHYDVDDFKTLLLKGEKNAPGLNAPAPPPVTFQGQHSLGDSSSNTDASSISRQSIFEPTIGPNLQGSPRSSHESLPSDESQQLVGSPPPTTAKVKPAAPKPRHGKIVKPKAPQTLSFEDPMLSFSSSTTSVTLPASPTSRPSSTPSGLETPLPVLHGASSSAYTAEAPDATTETSKRDAYSASSDLQASATPPKRNPPAPPLSRRHSLRPKPFAASERSTPISEEVSLDPFPLSQSSPIIATKVAPPPPPRRVGQTKGGSPSSISTHAPAAPIQSQPRTDDLTTRSTKTQPPTPPNRSPSLSAVKRQSTQPSPRSPSMAPPLPPRRRGSSASSLSYNQSCLSGNYSTTTKERIRSDSNASSISQVPMTSPATSYTESRDVLADLSALQREVDELRGKFGN